VDSIRRYTKHINIGTEKRGTVILTKEGLSLTHIRCLPSGRAMTAILNGICLVYILDPSGREEAGKRILLQY
jgi:hypothetical protein